MFTVRRLGYIDVETHARLYGSCNSVIGMIVNMSNQPEKWSYYPGVSFWMSFGVMVLFSVRKKTHAG